MVTSAVETPNNGWSAIAVNLQWQRKLVHRSTDNVQVIRRIRHRVISVDANAIDHESAKVLNLRVGDRLGNVLLKFPGAFACVWAVGMGRAGKSGRKRRLLRGNTQESLTRKRMSEGVRRCRPPRRRRRWVHAPGAQIASARRTMRGCPRWGARREGWRADGRRCAWERGARRRGLAAKAGRMDGRRRAAIS